MPEVVVCNCHKAVLRQESHKVFIAADVLRNAVGNLHYTPHTAFRKALARMDGVYTCGRFKGKISEYGHNQF